MMLALAGALKMVLAMLSAGLENGLRAESGKPGDASADGREAFDDRVHPREGIHDHQVDKAAAQDVLDHPAKEIRRIELALGGVLDPGDDDVDEEQVRRRA